jgi:hypothetical protein
VFFLRCIVSVLFLIGEGKEEPDVIDQLLDVEANPCRYIFVFMYPFRAHKSLDFQGPSFPRALKINTGAI